MPIGIILKNSRKRGRKAIEKAQPRPASILYLASARTRPASARRSPLASRRSLREGFLVVGCAWGSREGEGLGEAAVARWESAVSNLTVSASNPKPARLFKCVLVCVHQVCVCARARLRVTCQSVRDCTRVTVCEWCERVCASARVHRCQTHEDALHIRNEHV